MIFARLTLLGVVVLGANPLTAAPVCVLNQAGQQLFLVVDDLDGRRAARMVATGGQLCLKVASDVQKAVVGVFASADALEGCSRLTRPGQTETLLDFMEFDNCRWVETDRTFD